MKFIASIAAAPPVVTALLLTVVVCLTVTGPVASAADTTVMTVKTGAGPMRGTKMKSDKGRDVDAFLAIPYAEPPTGQLRFKRPVAKTPWTETLDATKDSNPCTQLTGSQMDPSNPQRVIGSEDCLVLNVYTSQLTTATRNENKGVLPVAVYFHGGGFNIGNALSAKSGPGFMLDNDVVLVTVQYRLSALGFLSTNDESSPGNYGLLDQTLALEWVRDNIAAFGGDGSKVAIFGQSAGASSVLFHVLSPLSAGLFRGAVALSGGAFSPKSIQHTPLAMATQLASDLNCSTETTERMVECLRKIPAETIGNISNSATLRFFPTVDKHFLPALPTEIAADPEQVNSVPVITGTVFDELAGAYPMSYFENATQEKLEKAIDQILNLETAASQSVEAMRLVKERYFSTVNTSDGAQVRLGLIKVQQDEQRVVHITQVRTLVAAGVPTYDYSYDYVLSNADPTANSQNGHGADLYVIFGDNQFGKTVVLDDDDKKTAATMTSLLTDFADTGKPSAKLVPKWEKSGADVVTRYHINRINTVQMYDSQGDDVYHFWTVVVPGAAGKKCAQ